MNEELFLNTSNEILKLICEGSNLEDMINLSANVLSTDIGFFDLNIDFKAISRKYLNYTFSVNDDHLVKYHR